MSDPLPPEALRLLEAEFLGAPGDPRIVAGSLRRPLTMLAAETWHFGIAGAALFLVGTLLGNVTVQRLDEPWSTFYLPLVVGWAALNGAYLAWYFLGRRDQRTIDAILSEAYAVPASGAVAARRPTLGGDA